LDKIVQCYYAVCPRLKPHVQDEVLQALQDLEMLSIREHNLTRARVLEIFDTVALAYDGPSLVVLEQLRSSIQPDDLYRSEMLGVETNFEAPQAPESGAVVAPPQSKPHDKERRAFTDKDSILDLCRRRFLVRTETSLLDTIIVTGELLDRSTARGQLGWWSALYSFWVGSIKYQLASRGDWKATYGIGNPEENIFFNPTSEFSPEVDTTPGLNAMGPSAYGFGAGVESTYTELVVPYYSPYRHLFIPKLIGQNVQKIYNTGILKLASTGAINNSLMVFASAGEDFSMGYLREVPDMLHIYRPGVKSPLTYKHTYVSQMNGVGVSSDAAFAPLDPTDDGGRPPNPLEIEDLNEKSISFLDVAERPTRIRRGTWSTSHGPGSGLEIIRVPIDLIVDRNSVVFETFTFWRGNPVVSIMLNSAPQQAGMLILYWTPGANASESNYFIADSAVSQTSTRHIKIPAGGSRRVSFEIPFADPRTHLRIQNVLDGVMSLGTLRLSVLNQLRVADDADVTAVDYTMWVSFPKARNTFTVLRPIVTVDDEKDEYVSEGGSWSRPLSKDTIEANPIPTINSAGPNIASADTRDAARILDIYAGSVSTHNCEFGTPEDETKLSFLMRPTFYSRITQRSRDPPDTYLAAFPLTPTTKGILAGPGEAYSPTLMEYAVTPFSLWKGDMIFRFEFVVTFAHSTRLAFSVHYGSSGEPPAPSASLSQYTHYMDVTSTNSTFEFVVPWRSDRRHLRVFHGIGENGEDFSMGWATLLIVNSLSYNGVSSSIDCNIYVGMRNFELLFPGPVGRGYEIFNPYPHADEKDEEDHPAREGFAELHKGGEEDRPARKGPPELQDEGFTVLKIDRKLSRVAISNHQTAGHAVSRSSARKLANN